MDHALIHGLIEPLETCLSCSDFEQRFGDELRFCYTRADQVTTSLVNHDAGTYIVAKHKH